MREATLSSEERRELFAWLRGGDATPDPEMESRFLDAVAILVRDRLNELPNPVGDPVEAERRRRMRESKVAARLSVKALVEEALENSADEDEESIGSLPRDSDRIAAEGYSEAGIDSVELARALVFFASLEGHSINMSQIQATLFIVYGTWLSGRNERLTRDHPQMWEYGPVFPRAYNQLKRSPSSGEAEYNSLRESHPEVWRYLGNCFRLYCWTSGCVLNAPLVTASSPWGQTRRENPGKWGAIIEDPLIDDWFTKNIK